MAIHSISMLNLLLCLSSIIFLLSSFLAQADNTFKYCDENANYAIKVSGVEILPDPVVRGEELSFKTSAYTGEPIPRGDLLYEITYAETPSSTYVHDLCMETSCPVSVGNFVLTHTTSLPPIAPSGTYNVKLTIEDKKEEKLLTCIIFPFKVGSESSSSVA